MFRFLAKPLIWAIKSALYAIDPDHRIKEEIACDDVKKFTHVVEQDFQSDFGRAKRAFRTVPYPVWEVRTETKTLTGADKHRVIRSNGSTAWLQDLRVGDLIKTDRGDEAVASVRDMGIRTHMYCLEIETDDLSDPHNHLFYANGLLSHNTTCAGAFLLWEAMFRPDTTILIVANTYNMALEIMARIRFSYENLPDHIRAGARDYNKESILFDNGSRIISRATTPNSGRGLSVTRLFVDEFAFVQPRMAKDFWTAVRPVLATGGSCIITSTPKNDEDQFAQIYKAALDNIDEFGNARPGNIGSNDFYAITVPWYELPERDAAWAATEKASLGEAKFRQEHCCVVANTIVTILHDDGRIVDTRIGELLTELASYDKPYQDGDLVPNSALLRVLTPAGWQSFAGVSAMGVNTIHAIEFENGVTIQSSPQHEFVTTEGLVRADAITTAMQALSEDGPVAVLSATVTDSQEMTYSLIEVENGHIYYTAGIASKNCEFVTDDETLINPMTLTRLKGQNPLFYIDTMRWYREIEPNKAYVLALDPCLGVGRDYAAIQVFQLPEMVQVAEWQNNTTKPRDQVMMLLKALDYLSEELKDNSEQRGEPEIFWTVENNSIGETVLMVIEDTGFERFAGLMISEKRRAGVRRTRKGLLTTPRSKLGACSRLKSLVESDRITINSGNAIRELKNFVSSGYGFKAKPGEHDDLVSALLLIVRAVDRVIASGYENETLRERIYDDELYDDGDGDVEAMPIVL